MASPYLERRLRSYREALREIRKKHALRRTAKAVAKRRSISGSHLRLISDGPRADPETSQDPPA